MKKIKPFYGIIFQGTLKCRPIPRYCFALPAFYDLLILTSSFLEIRLAAYKSLINNKD